jgi:hypothetical protein
MDEFKQIMRRALIKNYYREIIGKPKTKQNKEYYALLKHNNIT